MSIASADLKTQGNALFAAKKYGQADKKYTGAIESSSGAADPKELAVLYANRAACRLSLKRYMDADTDATKATQLDPTYAKAFARLASAQDWLGHYPESIKNWKRALDALPKSNLNPVEQIQKIQYETSLKATTATMVKQQNTVIDNINSANGRRGIKGRMPWDLAAKIIPQLSVQRPVTAANLSSFSSAWVIHGAYQDFMSGVHQMSQLHTDRAGNMVGKLGAIVDLTNGIMRDTRVMHFPDPDFISKYNKQIVFEARSYGAWGWANCGADLVIQEALARQQTEGWDAVRPALSITIRAWIMQAMVESGVKQQHDVAVEFYKNCLRVIRTLREHWSLESKADRGIIFEKTFIFGIQRLYIDTMIKSYDDSDHSAELLEELFKESDLLLCDIEAMLHLTTLPQDPVDPGLITSFSVYPLGQAYAMKGFYYTKMSVIAGNEPKEFFRKAALEYIKAANYFPEDDEHYPWFLHVALGKMLNARSFPLRETLDVMKRITVASPKAKEIWEFSSLRAWDTFEGVVKQEEKLRDMVAQGKLTMDTCIGPEVVEF